MIPDWIRRLSHTQPPTCKTELWAAVVHMAGEDIHLCEITPEYAQGSSAVYACDGIAGETMREAILNALRRAHRSFLDDLDDKPEDREAEADAVERHAAHVAALSELYAMATNNT